MDKKREAIRTGAEVFLFLCYLSFFGLVLSGVTYALVGFKPLQDRSNNAIKTECNVTSHQVVQVQCNGNTAFQCYDGTIAVMYTTIYNETLSAQFTVYQEDEMEEFVINDLNDFYPLGSNITCYYQRLYPKQISLNIGDAHQALVVLLCIFLVGIPLVILSMIGFCCLFVRN